MRKFGLGEVSIGLRNAVERRICPNAVSFDVNEPTVFDRRLLQLRAGTGDGDEMFFVVETGGFEGGDRFDLARYHEAVLDLGSVPVKYLPELVRERLLGTR